MVDVGLEVVVDGFALRQPPLELVHRLLEVAGLDGGLAGVDHQHLVLHRLEAAGQLVYLVVVTEKDVVVILQKSIVIDN